MIESPLRQLFQPPAVNLHSPYVSSACAVRGEYDIAAIRRNNRHDIVLRVSRQLSLMFTVGGCDPDVHVAAGLRGVYQPPVGRPIEAEPLAVVIAESRLNLRCPFGVKTSRADRGDPDARNSIRTSRNQHGGRYGIRRNAD